MSFQIVGTGMCVPERVVTNGELSQLVETSDEWISQRVGVRSRHICTSETTADLAVSGPHTHIRPWLRPREALRNANPGR